MILAVRVPADRILKVIGSLEKPWVAEQIIKETLDKFGKIDVLVKKYLLIFKKIRTGQQCWRRFKAGPFTGGNAESGESWLYFCRQLTKVFVQIVTEIIPSSVAQLSLLALPHLKKTKGNVLNISSVGSVRITPPFLFYASLKAALDHWSRGFAQMGAPEVRVNTLKSDCMTDTK